MRRTRTVAVGTVALALASCHGRDHHETSAPDVPLTADQTSQLVARIAKSKVQIAEADAGWEAGIAAVDPAAVDTGPSCGALDMYRSALAGNPQGSEWGSWDIGTIPLDDREGSMYSMSRTPFPATFVGVHEPMPKVSPEAWHRAQLVERASAHTWFTFDDRIKEATFDKLRTTDVLIAITEVVRPIHKSNELTFTPGTVTARVWAFDHERGAVVCAGVVTATNSPEVDVRSTNLSDDLMTDLVRAIPGGLHPVAVAAAADAHASGSAAHATGDVFDLVDPSSGTHAVMKYGQAWQADGMLHVSLADDAQPGCALGPHTGAFFDFAIPRGPASAFWTGAPFGVETMAGGRGTGFGLGAAYMTITAHVAQLEAGAHVTGTIDTNLYGHGTWDATLCPGIDASALHALPKSAPAGAVPGYKSAIAVVGDEDKSSLVWSVKLFTAAGITCANLDEHDTGTDAGLSIGDIGGASTTTKTQVGTPQPASSTVRDGSGGSTSFGPDATWVQLDAMTTTPGKLLTGKVVIDAGETHIGGTFRAQVCKRS